MASDRTNRWNGFLRARGSFFLRQARRLLASGLRSARYYPEHLFDGSLLRFRSPIPAQWPRRLVLSLESLEDRQLLTGVQFSLSDYQVKNTSPYAVITVSLDTPLIAPEYVHYQTSDGTATAGADYTAVSGTLIFDPNQLSQSFEVPILNVTHAGGSATLKSWEPR